LTDTPDTRSNDSAPSTTTREEDRHTLAARNINMIWEYTQAIIATSVVVATLVYALRYAAPEIAVVIFFSNAFGLVIGFYFGRTNHARTGGTIGTK
jgi:hypothetical protein